MCGRYYLAENIRSLEERYHLTYTDLSYMPRYNIAPTQYAPVIIKDGTKQLKLFKWGLIPSWAKDLSIGTKMINARVETLLEKKSFRDAFYKRRCLVPASGFYEWEKIGNYKQPYEFHLSNHKIFSMAGLWDVWTNLKGEKIYSFTIITTEPNEYIRPYHHRMAVILHKEDEDRWLDGEIDNLNDLNGILKPYPSRFFEKQRVSEAVNSVRNDYPELIQAASVEEQIKWDI
ncbi:putative SOS response-associated peptidase YedK [Anaerosolibacter carboniphilus]|uniref:Abasic site processing protein n=1 Tax=Anaerosolibacter carboniphilus TaxID=1417629 RepID=A0A841L793_9FIRM|nr:SOS response-associated peptidase [Anaerosolibacter carboniphilus]MBB6218269.1 putative SOS response-associated peptidase YedK [Anaerosolibacter carboniphilus]